MLWFSLNVGQSASLLMLFLIGEVTHYARSAPDLFAKVNFDPINPNLAVAALNSPQNGSSAAPGLEMVEIDDSFDQLEKALSLSKSDVAHMKQDKKTFTQQLVQIYKNYSNSTCFLDISDNFEIWLIVFNISKNDGSSEIEDVNGIKSEDDSISDIFVKKESGINILQSSRNNQNIGFFRRLHRNCGETRETQEPVQMGYNSIKMNNGLIHLKNNGGQEDIYRAGKSLIWLKEIMRIRDPFKRLAKVAGRRTLKIEFILEDQLNQLYIIFFDDFQRPPTETDERFDFSIKQKKMGVYKFRTYLEGNLAIPVTIEQNMFLKWNPETLKYDLEDEIITDSMAENIKGSIEDLSLLEDAQHVETVALMTK